MSMMRGILDKPISILIFCVITMGMAIFMTTLLNQEFLPDLDLPTITVTTEYEGSGPVEIETGVTNIIEEAVAGVTNIDTVSSTSSEGYSNINLEFNWGTNLDVASNEVRDELGPLADILPEDADTPYIEKLSVDDMRPVAYVSVSSDVLNSDEIRDYAEDTIEPLLRKVTGVSRVDINGGRVRQIRVDVYQNRLAAYNITMTEINDAIRKQSVQFGAGEVLEGDIEVKVRGDARFKSPEEAAATTVAHRTDSATGKQVPILLRDLADVYYGYEEEVGYAARNGKPAFIFLVYKASDGNEVKVANGIKEVLERVNKRIPNTMKAEVLWQSSRQVILSIKQVFSSMTTGATLTILVLLVFLRNVKSSLIVALTMPVSIAFALMMMYMFGLSLNVMSLAGLNLGVGMIVDGGIVLLENITRYREKGVSSKTSAILGSQEMIGSVSGGVLTSVAVFFPMVLFAKDLQIIGVVLNDLSFTVVIVLLSSLLFAIILVPVLAGVFMPVETTKQRPLKGLMKILDNRMNAILTWLDNKYATGIDWALNHRKTVYISISATVFFAFFIAGKVLSFSMMPQSDADMYQVQYEMPQGTPLAKTKEVGHDIGARIARETGTAINDILLFCGFDTEGKEARYAGQLSLILPDYDNRPIPAMKLVDKVRELLIYYPGVTFSVVGMGAAGARDFGIELWLYGDDREALNKTSELVVEAISNIPILKEADSDLDMAVPEMALRLDRSKAYDMGLSVREILDEMNYNVDGDDPARYEDNGDDIDIYTQLKEEDRNSLSQVDVVFFKNKNTGEKVTLADVARLERGFGPVAIRHQDQIRQVTITAQMGLKENGVVAAQNDGVAQAMAAIESSVVIPDVLTLEVGGDSETMREIGPMLIAVIIISIVLVYGIMASQFESLTDPFIIILTIFTVPAGPVLVYIMMGQDFTVFSIIGMVMLVGIVVNNGIVLVDYTNLLRKREIPFRTAIIEAGRSRLRPVIMTSLTTILGMVPMAFDSGEGTQMTQPIGMTVLGGMTTGTVLTLFLVPVLYYNFYNKIDEMEQAEINASKADRKRQLSEV